MSLKRHISKLKSGKYLMIHLGNLLKKINDYYLFATAQTAWTMPDDEDDEPKDKQDGFDTGLYSKIETTANQFSNRDIADEILLIGELYKKALQMGGGYTLVNKALSTALSNMDSLIDEGTVGADELEAAEDILNEVSQDLRQRAKTATTRIDDNVAMKAFKEVRQAFNQQAVRDEIEQQPQKFVSQGPGDKDTPGQQSGYITGPKLPPKTPQKYQQEIERYTEDLNNPNYDQTTKSNISEMIKVVGELAQQLATTIDLQDQLKLAPDDQALQQAVEQSLNKQQALQDQRSIIRSKLNKTIQQKKLNELEKQETIASDPAEKLWLQEKAKLQRLRLSTDLHKGDEIKYQQMLVNSLGTMDGGTFHSQKLSPETLQKIKDGIEAGKLKRITKEKYDREQSVVRALQHGKIGPVVKRPGGKRGGGLADEKINDYKTELATYSGLVDKLGEKINTAVHVARLGITQEKNKTHNALKPYVDNLSKAIQKKDNAAKYEAIRVLKQKMIEEMWRSKAPAVRVLEKNVRLLPYFNKYKGELQTISKWQDASGIWNLDNSKKAYAQQVISNIDKLTKIYGRFYSGKKGQLELFFDSALEHLAKVVERLKSELENNSDMPLNQLPQGEQIYDQPTN